MSEDVDRRGAPKKYDDHEFIDAVEQLNADPDSLPTTGAVADVVGCRKQRVRQRAAALVDSGRLQVVPVSPEYLWLPPGESVLKVMIENYQTNYGESDA